MTNSIRIQILAILVLFVLGCNPPPKKAASSSSPSTCRGHYSERDSKGNLKRYYEFEASPGVCWTQSEALTQWESTSETWTKNNTECAPVPNLQSMTLSSDGNYYSYRDGKFFIDLNAQTGVYRKISIGESRANSLVYDKGVRKVVPQGSEVFSREQGCIYKRTATGIDAAYGTQLLLDTDKYASNEYFVPFEIYKIEEDTLNTMKLRRFDFIADWDEKMCPELRTPWGFCDLLKNGDYMFYPLFTNAEKVALRDEAIKIRTEYSFKKVAKSEFDNLWNSLPETHYEAIRTDWLYEVSFLVDTPPWIDQAWREYVMGIRPRMPVAGSD